MTDRMSRRTFYIALMLLLTLGTIRGGATSVAKYVSVSGVPPLGYAFWQSSLAALLLLVVRFDKIGELRGVAAEWRLYLVCGMIGTAFPNTLFFFVVKHIPAGYMAVILTTVPLITYGFALLLQMEKPDGLRALGIVVGFAGAVLIASPSVDGGFLVNWFVVLALLCPAGYALVGIYVARHSVQGSDPLMMAAGTQLAAASFLLPTALLSGQFYPIWAAPGLPDLLIVLHGVIAAAAYSLFFRIVHMAGPVFYSQSAYVIAVTGIGWGMLVFGERHAGWFWTAVALILGGLTLVNLRHPRSTRERI